MARALTVLLRVSEAFPRIQISYPNVRAITRVATARDEESLLGAARCGTTHHIEKRVRRFRRIEWQLQAVAAAESDARRSFREGGAADGRLERV